MPIPVSEQVPPTQAGTMEQAGTTIRNAAEGRCFVWYTSENEELTNCDRVYVFYRGVVTDEIPRAELTEDRVLRSSFREVEAVAS